MVDIECVSAKKKERKKKNKREAHSLSTLVELVNNVTAKQFR